MDSFSSLRSDLALSEAQVRELLGIDPEKFLAYELGTERPSVSELQAMKGYSMGTSTAGVEQRTLGFVPEATRLKRQQRSSGVGRKPRQKKIENPKLRLIRNSAKAPAQTPAPFTFIDLFAGIGGMRLGFEAAGGKCVFTSEWNTYSQKTYQANFPDDEHEIAGDIRDVQSGDIPEHDVLVAGFPCQPFSIAGVSKKNALNRPHGFDCETQGTLFFDIERIIRERKPKAFLLENVKNLVSHDGGRTFEVILNSLQHKLGYHVSWRVIDAKSFVPQHRERTFIVGFREANDFALNKIKISDPLRGPRLSSILHSRGEDSELPYTDGKRVGEKYTLTKHLWDYLQAYAEKHRKAGNGFGFGLVGPDNVARTLSARYFKDGSEILIRQRGTQPRRLTPRECARLMGFDETGRRPFRIPVSDTQAYKQFGNAVVVPVVRMLAEQMASALAETNVGGTKRVMRG